MYPEVRNKKYIKKKYPALKFHFVIIHEFLDKKVIGKENEYAEKFEQTEYYTIWNVHLVKLLQSYYFTSNLYEQIFKEYNFNLDNAILKVLYLIYTNYV